MSNILLKKVWNGIKDRCYNKNRLAYKDYGGRGIYLQQNWFNDFSLFEKYIVSLPNYNETLTNSDGQKLTLDRIDNNKSYQRGNLRWATMKEQCNNQRKKVSWYNKETVNIKENIAQAFIRKRKEDNQKIESICSELKINTDHFLKIENGLILPSRSVALKICNYLGLDIHLFSKDKLEPKTSFLHKKINKELKKNKIKTPRIKKPRVRKNITRERQGELIQRFRENIGMSQKELADGVNEILDGAVSLYQSRIATFEREGVKKQSTLKAIAKVLKIDVKELL